MKIISLVTLLSLLLTAGVHAGESLKDLNALPILPQPLPNGVLLTPNSDPCQWTITFVPLASENEDTAPKPSAPPPSIASVTKSGKIYLVEFANQEGKMVRWKSNQFQATYLPGGSSPLFSYSPGSLYYLDFSRSDFPELSWISARNYAGAVKIGETMGLLFKGKVPSRGDHMGLVTMPHSSSADAVAVIDAETRRPLLLQIDGVILHYNFTNGAAEISLPKEVQQAFESLHKQIQRASMIPPG